MRCAWHNGIIIVINWVWLCAGVARRAKHKYTCYRSFIHSYISSGVGYTCRLSWPIIYLLINTCYADVRLCVIHCRRRCAIVPSNNSSILWCVCVCEGERERKGWGWSQPELNDGRDQRQHSGQNELIDIIICMTCDDFILTHLGDDWLMMPRSGVQPIGGGIFRALYHSRLHELHFPFINSMVC